MVTSNSIFSIHHTDNNYFIQASCSCCATNVYLTKRENRSTYSNKTNVITVKSILKLRERVKDNHMSDIVESECVTADNLSPKARYS